MKVSKKFPPLSSKLNPRRILTDYQRRIEQELEEEGVTLFDAEADNLNINDDYLVLPKSITDVPSHELGEYLNAFTQQKVYMRTMLGRIELIVEDVRRDYHTASEALYRKYTIAKITETAKERLINADPDVKPHYELFIDARKKLNIVQYSLNNIEDIIFLLSREVTRRVGDFNEENRNSNVGRR